MSNEYLKILKGDENSTDSNALPRLGETKQLLFNISMTFLHHKAAFSFNCSMLPMEGIECLQKCL